MYVGRRRALPRTISLAMNKIYPIDGLPHFVVNGDPLAALRRSSTKIALNCLEKVFATLC